MTVVPTPDNRPATPHWRTSHRYISLQDAATYTGLDVKTLRRRISDGTLTGYRAGGRVIRVDVNELDTRLFTVVPSAGRA